MEWLQQNSWVFGLISAGLALIIVSISIYVTIKTKNISNNIIESSLKMTTSLMYDSDIGDEFLNINIFNTTFRDVVISDFGLDYKNQRLNFVAEYIETKNLMSLPVIPARSSINFRFDPQRLEKFILAHNYKSKSISSIKMVVVDSVGNQFLKTNRGLTSVLRERQKERVRTAKIIVHNNKVKNYKESHDDREPLTHAIWKMFHHTETTPELINIANNIQEKQSFSSKTKQIPDVAKESNIKNDSEKALEKNEVYTVDKVITSSSGEIKMTYLSSDKNKKSKKKKNKEEKLEEKSDNGKEVSE